MNKYMHVYLYATIIFYINVLRKQNIIRNFSHITYLFHYIHKIMRATVMMLLLYLTLVFFRYFKIHFTHAICVVKSKYFHSFYANILQIFIL